MATTLYHGSSDKLVLEDIRDDGLFGGIFCSASRLDAASHGDYVSEIDLPDDSVLTHYELNYEIADIATIERVLRRELRDGADIDRAWEIVVESAGCAGAEDEDMFGDDESERGWEAQRIRGCVARALGYRAVEMGDEHGTTWLVVGAS